MDVLCLGSAVIDIVASPVAGPESWKEKQRIDSISFHLGGDAANQCVRLADTGCSVSACIAAGSDGNGQLLESMLKKRGVDTSMLRIKTECATGTAVVLVDAEGNRNTFAVKGAHSLFDKNDLPGFSLMQDVKALSIASFFSLSLLEKDGMEDFLRRFKTETGGLVFADLGSDKLGLGLEGIRRFLPYVDYFLPSEYDARDMTGVSSPGEAARIFRDCGCRCVIIKRGAEGCCYLAENSEGSVKALDVKPVDTTGAGDCMTALFISRILKGDRLDEALRYACAGASLSTLSLGASDVSLSEEAILNALENHSFKND